MSLKEGVPGGASAARTAPLSGKARAAGGAAKLREGGEPDETDGGGEGYGKCTHEGRAPGRTGEGLQPVKYCTCVQMGWPSERVVEVEAARAEALLPR